MPFARMLGVELSNATPAQVIAAMTVRAELCSVGDCVHGGALMAFSDCLGAIGAYLNLPTAAKGTTTVESKTNFLARAPCGTRLVGRSIPISVNRRISVWQTQIVDQDDRPVALTIQTQLVV